MRLLVAMLSLSACALSACALFACAEPLENAILEVELTLPPNSTRAEPLYAVVQAQAGDADFFVPWTAEPATFEMPREESSVRFSLVSELAHAAIGVKIRYCEDPRCAIAIDDRAPEVHVRIERPFHLREYSSVVLRFTDIPPAFEDVDVDKCAIRACTDEARATYCTADVHVCDQ
jgi:hypothetical protein